MRAKILQIMGFYNILYNISNFSFGPNFPFNGLPSGRELYQEQEFFNSTIKILMSSWRSSAMNQFDTDISLCVEFCKTNSYDSTYVD